MLLGKSSECLASNEDRVYEKSGTVNVSNVRFGRAVGVSAWRQESLNVPGRQGLGAHAWF